MNNKLKGILLILGAAAGFAFMNLFVKLSGDLPTFQKAFFRNLVACLIASFAIIKNPHIVKTAKGNFGGILARSIFGLSGVVLNFYAISGLNIADASLLNKLSPFFAMIFSIFLLKEKVRKAEWAIVALAFFGAIFVIKPSFSYSVLPAVAGFFSGMFAGLAYTFVRKVTKNGVAGSMVVFSFSAISTVILLPFFIMGYKPMTHKQLFFLIMAGVSAAVGQYFITFAYKFAPAKEISVFDYTQVIFATLLGLLILGEAVDYLSFFGYFIIFAAAVLRWRYNLKKD